MFTHKKRLVVFVVLSFVVFSPVVVFAQNTEQSQCFSTLKENMAEAAIFTDPLTQLKNTTYTQLEPKFSQYYKNLASFGIEIDKPDLEMRIYSFGEQTGYIHPPKLPFPSSYKSDMWIEPAREYILAEEYVLDQNAKRHFIDCVFFQIVSEDLMSVTRDRYLYDGPMISLTKSASDESYKAWYSENLSFDYENKPFVTWKRLFIYPESTQNSYFDKYSVADAFPARKVTSFNTPSLSPKQNYNKNTSISTTSDKIGSVTTSALSPAFSSAASSGIDTVFPLTTYYQAIENQFPEFAKELSLRGTLKYDTFKQLASEQNPNPEVGKLLKHLFNYQSLAYYSFAKDKEEQAKRGVQISNLELDNVLFAMKDGDWAVDQLSRGIPLERLSKSVTNPRKGIFALLASLGAWIAIFLWRKRKSIIKQSNLIDYV